MLLAAFRHQTPGARRVGSAVLAMPLPAGARPRPARCRSAWQKRSQVRPAWHPRLWQRAQGRGDFASGQWTWAWADCKAPAISGCRARRTCGGLSGGTTWSCLKQEAPVELVTNRYAADTSCSTSTPTAVGTAAVRRGLRKIWAWPLPARLSRRRLDAQRHRCEDGRPCASQSDKDACDGPHLPTATWHCPGSGVVHSAGRPGADRLQRDADSG